MLPVIQLGPLALQTYLLCLMIGLWAGLAVSARAAASLGLDGDHLYNAVLTALLAGIVAARLAHVVAFWPAYAAQPLAVLSLSTRQFMPWAGIAAALAVGGWYIAQHRLPAAAFLDALAPGALVTIMLATLGNLVGGQPAGAPSSLPWAIDVWGVARHPSEVYEALALLAVLVAVWRRLQGAARPGAAWIAVLGYGATRLLLEPFRETSAALAGTLRLPQVLGLLAVLLALWALRPETDPSGAQQEV